MTKRPEVLAPAGDRAAMEAAAAAGADAVYFGLKGFNARARAENFDGDDLEGTLRWLHARGVRGYVTLNTLVFDAELRAVEAAVRTCASAGADAIIVQDLGVARLARAIAPDLPIHASTQMTCTDAGAIELAREIGASRVILARELSVDEIAAIRRETDVELEVFVHGALCVAYSGQCLTSEAIGGRSANRGACAQACRLPYELVVDGVLRDLGDVAYLLSPEDLEATSVIPDLCALGVASVKIEGRLKGPAYVGATVKLYRAAIDAAMGQGSAPSDRDREAALQTFTRGSGPGFLRGVDHQRLVEGRACDHRGLLVGDAIGTVKQGKKQWIRARLQKPLARGEGILVEGGFAGEGEIGGRIWGISVDGRDVEVAPVGREALVWLGPEKALPERALGRVFRTSDPANDRAIEAALARSQRKVAIDVRLEGKLGDKPVLVASVSNEDVASIEVDAPLTRADRTPLDEASLRAMLDRLGDTTLALGRVTLAAEGPARLPPSSINRARRALVEAATASLHRAHEARPASLDDLIREASAIMIEPPPPGLFALCRNVDQARAALAAGATGVYLDFLELTGLGVAARALRAEGAFVGVAPPRIRKPGEEKIDRYLAALEPDAILVRGLGALRASFSGPLRIADASLNVTNTLSAAEVLGRGVAAFTPSFDLDADQLTALCQGHLAPFAEVVAHHPMPLFHMEHCVFAHTLSDGRDHRTCGRPCDHHALSLRDRAGMDHPIEADVGCRNTVFHAAPQSAAHLVPKLVAAGVRRFRVELVREGAEETTRVITLYKKLIEGAIKPSDVTRGLRVEGGYGVVKGSLRVIAP